MAKLIGRTIGQYQLVEALDETGTILVYKAFQPAMNRYVALKVLDTSLVSDPIFIERFQRAGELATQIQHPRILPVYETGQDQGFYFRAELLAEHGSLRERLSVRSANRLFDLNQAIRLFKDIVAGLEAIHARGYIHGNLKPGNILLDGEERPLLANLGQAELSTSSPNPYMAPEQAQGGVVDRRVDIYGMGVLLYEVLVGETPLVGVVTSPRTRRPDLPESLDPVVFKAMAQNPDYRFQTPGEFFSALERALMPYAPVAQPVFSTMQPAPVSYPSTPQNIQQVTIGEQKRGATNWLAIILGVLVAGIVCIGAYMFLPGLLGEDQVTPGNPTQPPSMPTQPPEQPTQPPEQPTLPVEPPVQLPAQPSDGLPSICSSLGLTGGIVFMASAMRLKRRRKP